jgi:hypothetical protein
MAAPATTSFRRGPNGTSTREPAATGIARDPQAADVVLPESTRRRTSIVDGGISDNLGMRGVLDALSFLEALHNEGVPTPLDNVKGSSSSSSIRYRRPTNWDESEAAPEQWTYC